MIDLDRFKELNDLHGHEFGDRALALVASALRDSLRDEQDLVARYGGEEFVALLPKRTLAGALPIAERIRAAVHEVVLPRPSDGSPVRITTSVGVAAAVPSPSNSALGLLRAADAALYEAKANGRDCVYPLPDHQPGPLSAAR